MPVPSAPETLTELRGDLVLAALCVGQFHAPCQVDADRLLVRADEALLRALDALGLHMATVVEPFSPTPLFVSEEAVLAQVAKNTRRQVRTHISSLDDDNDGQEDIRDVPSSNA
jgi:urease accessory protein UreE